MRDSSKRIHDDANPQQEPLPTGPKAATKQRPALALLREALTELHITGTCRSVAYELMTYWSPGGTVFPAVQTLADDMGLKRRVIQYQIKTLERVGLWKRKRRTGKTNLYELHLPGDAQARFVKLSPVHVGAPPRARGCTLSIHLKCREPLQGEARHVRRTRVYEVRARRHPLPRMKRSRLRLLR